MPQQPRPRALPRVSTSQIAQRGLCVNLRKADGTAQDAWFAKQEREALNKLKASLAAKKKPIDEADEKVRARKKMHSFEIKSCSALLTVLMFIALPQVRLQKIIEAVGVRQQIREELTVKLLLWKHDEDLVIDK